MKFFFIYVFILALLLNTKVQSQSLQTSDSLVEKTIQKVLVSNLPVFLTKNNEGGFFLVKMEISNSDSIPVIQLLNESRSEALQYFKNNFSKKCIKDLFQNGNVIIIPILFYDLSSDFGLTKKSANLIDYQLIKNTVFDTSFGNQNIIQKVLFLRPQKIGIAQPSTKYEQ
ncbi:MAG: hypothetical protein KBA90_10415 [Chitinophagaceae bacterium]|nr:hypothetical protein [Chitinophagaceae bacterium]